MTRLPGAIFVVDIRREHIAIREAQKLNIPIFAMVDTNCDPREVDYPIPSNDDASKSIALILNHISKSVQDGLSERQQQKDEEKRIEEKEQSETKEIKEDSKSESVETESEIQEVVSSEKKKRTRKTIKKEN